MVEVSAITPTVNDKIVKVELTQVLSALDKARGFSSGKKHWITADADNNTFKVGQTFPSNIRSFEVPGPLHAKHLPFEKNGKYYDTELV